MSFTQDEIEYLASQQIGRLATIAPDGTPQASPVGFQYNPDLGTIDIGGFNMAKSKKYRNIADNDKVAFVIDDLASADPWRVRCLEIRGVAETTPPDPNAVGVDGALIRVHPRRIIAFGIESDQRDLDPHQMRANNRNVG